MEELMQVSTDRNVVELIELLKKNQMEREAANVADLVSYIDVLTRKLEMMNNQLDEMRKEVSDVRKTQDRTVEVKLIRAEDRITDSITRLSAYMIEQTQHRIDSLKKSVHAVKKFIVSKSKEIVADFKKIGKRALYNVAELLKTRHVLGGMKNSVEIGILETNDIISRIDDFGKDMREAKRAVREARQEKRNALRSFMGKDQKEYDNTEKVKKFSKTELAKKPWHWQRGVYESIKHFLESSLEKLDSLESAVRDSMAKEQNFEINERIFSGMDKMLFPVVAESEKKYGADSFEEYMKNDGEIEKTPVVVESEEKKR